MRVRAGGTIPDPSDGRGALVLSALAFASLALTFAFLAGRRGGWYGPAEVVAVGAAAIALLVAPARYGIFIVLLALPATPVIEGFAGTFDGGMASRDAVLLLAAAGSILAAAALRDRVRASSTVGEPARMRGDARTVDAGRQIATEVARARRSKRPLSLMLIEADGEPIPAGLRERLSRAIRAELRDTDLAASGDEDRFLVLLPYTSEDDARTAAERLRLGLPVRLAHGAEHAPRLSIGIAAFPRDSTREEELVELAQRALARARELGGNRTICTSIEADAPPGWSLAGT